MKFCIAFYLLGLQALCYAGDTSSPSSTGERQLDQSIVQLLAEQSQLVVVGEVIRLNLQDHMKQVHARFTGSRGTLALFGDSITVSLAFWAPLEGEPKAMSPEMARAHQRVKRYMKPECWRQWRGSDFGNEGRMTIRWAHANVDRWLQQLNPEVAVIMFGSNDLGELEVAEYEQKTREVVRRCLTNGTIVLLTTPPPRSGRLEKSKQFAEAVRKVARQEKVPLVDYFAAILERRPNDWDGTLPQFSQVPGDVYQVPTLISRDGVHPSNPHAFADYSDASLRNNGFALRNFLTLTAYAEIIVLVLAPQKQPLDGCDTGPTNRRDKR